MNHQTRLFEQPRTPTTRYQGSKAKLVSWIIDVVKELDFVTCLDAFGGTGVVSHALKALGKSVTYNDIQPFNQMIGNAIIANDKVKLTEPELVVQRHEREYDSFISDTFSGIYFTDHENQWLDVVTQNVLTIECERRKALAFYALFQSCIVKRPYNLFHRANLYMRTQNVKRSFGNKTTWDRSFKDHFINFVEEVNECVFAGERKCFTSCRDASEVPGQFDLVYIDSPYINSSGTGVNYGDFYHFLNGLVDYQNWGARLDKRRKHLPLIRNDDPWSDKKRIYEAFDTLFSRFSESIIVVSYRSDGIPSEEELVAILSKYKTVERRNHGSYKYVLSKNSKSKELILLGF